MPILCGSDILSTEFTLSVCIEFLRNKEICAKILTCSILPKKNGNDQQGNNNIINNLNDLIKMKDNLINELRIKLQNNGNNNQPVNFKDIMVINFVSTDQKISCGIQCLKTETFAEVEERLYQQYEEYREKNYNFITKGRLVLRFKKIFENNIQNQDKVQLLDLSSDE